MCRDQTCFVHKGTGNTQQKAKFTLNPAVHPTNRSLRTMSSPFLALALILLIFKAGVSAPCDQGIVNVSVSTFEDAQGLQDALTCSGTGMFYVEWTGEVNIGELDGGFTVLNGSSLNVTGIGGNAVINGDNRVRIFRLTGESHLYLNSISLENGLQWTGYSYGGAVFATEMSHVSATDCSFLNNSADVFFFESGGEV